MQYNRRTSPAARKKLVFTGTLMRQEDIKKCFEDFFAGYYNMDTPDIVYYRHLRADNFAFLVEVSMGWTKTGKHRYFITVLSYKDSRYDGLTDLWKEFTSMEKTEGYIEELREMVQTYNTVKFMVDVGRLASQ